MLPVRPETARPAPSPPHGLCGDSCPPRRCTQLECLGMKTGTAFRAGRPEKENNAIIICQRTHRFGPYRTDSPSSGFTGIHDTSVVRSPKKFRKEVNSGISLQTATDRKLLRCESAQLFPHFEFSLLQNTFLTRAGPTFILQKFRSQQSSEPTFLTPQAILFKPTQSQIQQCSPFSRGAF